MPQSTPDNDLKGTPADDTPKERAIVDRLVAKGFDLEVEDDDSLLASFEQLLADKDTAPPKEEYERLKKLEPFATEYTQHAADFQKWKAEQAAKSQATQEEPAAEIPLPPKIDQAAAQVVHAGLGTGKVTRTSQGLYETADPAYMPFVQQVNKSQLERREYFQRFEDDPAGFIGQFTKSELTKLEKKHAEEVQSIKAEMAEFRKERGKSAIDQFFKENYQEFWQVDEDGQLVTQAGKHQLSARGMIYAQAMQDLEDVVPDENKRHEKAVLLARRAPLAEPQEPADRKKKFLSRTAGKPGRTTDRTVEHSPKGKEATSGIRNRRMDWNELMRQTTAEIT